MSLFNSLSAFFSQTDETVNTNLQNEYAQGYDRDAGSPYGTPAHVKSVATPAGSPVAADPTDESTEREDLLDQHVAYYLKHHPEVNKKHSIHRVRPGVYNFNGREISVEWHYAEKPGEQGYLICIDGPLRQPFADYMEDNENGIEYDDKRLGKSALSQIHKGKRLSFGDSNKVYSRLEAMKVAKEQALVREKAAEYATNGMEVPQQELMTKYKKTLSQKLGERRQRRPEPEAAPAPAPVPQAQPQLPAAAISAPQPSLPAPPPASSPTASPAASTPAASPMAGSEKAPRTHGAPKYCAKHDKTEKRKKTKPHNEPCIQCGSVIQTNYVQFKLCPACSEKDHRCMCCGAPAVGPAASPKASQAPSSPMNARSSPASTRETKSPAKAGAQPMSPMNLFGMPDLFGAPGMGAQDAQGNGAGLFNSGAVISAWQGRPASQQMPAQQGNAFASSNAYAPQNAVASQNVYAPQNGYVSYNPMASQNVMVGQQF